MPLTVYVWKHVVGHTWETISILANDEIQARRILEKTSPYFIEIFKATPPTIVDSPGLIDYEIY